MEAGKAKPGTVLGSDFSGVVVKVGKNVTSPAVGDHVAGFVLGGALDDGGAFAQYVRVPADLACVLPEGWGSHETAATMGLSFWTAYKALYHPKQLGIADSDGQEWIYIHGGSCKLAGTTAGRDAC